MSNLSRLTPTGQRLAPLIDHTLLKPTATPKDVECLCEEARLYGFAAVCVLPALLPVAVACLSGSPVAPCTVSGFPLGASTTTTKAFEAEQAAMTGAREVDMVLALWALRARQFSLVREDMSSVVKAAGPQCAIKVILETCLLSNEEKVIACRLAVEANVRFVKTSTGLAGGGATVDDIRLMRATVGPTMGVKASGGVRTRNHAMELVEAGANRIGTSAGVDLVTQPS